MCDAKHHAFLSKNNIMLRDTSHLYSVQCFWQNNEICTHDHISHLTILICKFFLSALTEKFIQSKTCKQHGIVIRFSPELAFKPWLACRVMPTLLTWLYAVRRMTLLVYTDWISSSRLPNYSWNDIHADSFHCLFNTRTKAKLHGLSPMDSPPPTPTRQTPYLEAAYQLYTIPKPCFNWIYI